MNEEEYLAHFGTLGMKWYVRRYQKYGMGGYVPKHPGVYIGEDEKTKAKVGVSKAFAKSAKRADKLKVKTYKYKVKANKKQIKATKKLASGTTSKKIAKGYKYQARANKATKKALRLEKKDTKWIKKMEKTFGRIYVNDVSQDAKDRGKKYIYMLARGD